MKFEVEKDSKEQDLNLGDIIKLPQDINTGNAFFAAGYYMVVLTSQLYPGDYHKSGYTLLNLETCCIQYSLKCSEISLLYTWIKENICNGEIKIYSGDKAKMILKDNTK